MNNKERTEFGQFVIGRYDHYFDSVNNKANFWLAFNSFAIGVVLTTYKDIKEMVPCHVHSWFNFGLITFLFIASASCYFILIASIPYLEKKKRPNIASRSLIYFDDVAGEDLAAYRNLLSQADDETLANDLSRQSHSLAKGLYSKYRNLRIAGYLMLALLINFLYLIVTYVVGKTLF